jgi:hypothetical protein
MAETNIIKSPEKKNNSAMFSMRTLFFSSMILMERKEKIVLTIKSKIAKPVTSSIKEASSRFCTRIAVITIKHKPKRFEAVLSM